MLTPRHFLPYLVFVITCWTVPVNAQTDDHDHAAAHAHDDHSTALSLNNGEPWESDDALRRGMLEIRAAVTMLTPAFASGQLNQIQAKQLSEAVHSSVNTMIEQCQLAPEADANLHIILAEMLKGTAELQAAPLSPVGLPVLQKALESYGHYFNHVGWQDDEHAGHAH